MRASEFITEREEWEHMPTPTIQKQFDQWEQEKRGRNAITTIPMPRTATTPSHKLGPDSAFAPKQKYQMTPGLAKELGYPEGWAENDPKHLRRQMIDKSTGNIKLGPDIIVQPGTEEYAELRMKTDPITGMIHQTGKMPTKGSQPISREHEKKSMKELPPDLTKDKGTLWNPSGNHPKTQYKMIDPSREKYRT